MTGPPRSFFSTSNFDMSLGSAATNKWIVDFLRRNENPNFTLADIFESSPLIWVGPTEIPLGDLVRVGGPGLEYPECEKEWQLRVANIAKSIASPRDLPPLIVWTKKQDDNGYKLIVADGAHRMEALRVSGYDKAWALAGFPSSDVKATFFPHIDKNRGSEMDIAYLGDKATAYDAIRQKQAHWHTEHDAVEKLMEPHARKFVLDAPVGTGRFVELYKRLGCSVVGVDLSADMLSITAKKAEEVRLNSCRLIKASATDALAEKVDVAICVRFINLIPGDLAEKVILNLGRAAREEMLIHLTSINLDEISPSEHGAARKDAVTRYERLRSEPGFTPHILSDFVHWAQKADFKIAESIECQERHGHSKTHMHRLTRIC